MEVTAKISMLRVLDLQRDDLERDHDAMQRHKQQKE
jgi:hypothetical protein